ncbi:MAG TPA: ABC transporter ATP-binding protein [Candidatus Gallimonas intestinigallinarum]|uniref:ABC transporter ATP-binding protein n=1 Tax=Candidatus Gallimonas intestinigallinarum TaxID=2838604 RepID=A0A9D2IV68_9FIRM|nr:ABC transporter ATP-binding protein [Candidatus Gallimonas intestinigallinarum]
MIEIQGLKKSYGTKLVLDGVHLTVPDGAKFGLVGINGAGKSTLLRLIADVLRPDEGSILLDGECVTGNAKKREELFFLPDDPYYASGTTIAKLIDLYRAFYPFDRALFDKYASIFGLQLLTPIRNFSKGMKRQAFAALALACRPRYLLLDEAFDGLDPLARLELKRGLIEQEECTVLISSHSLRELEDICSGFALLDGGTIADAGDIHDALGKVHKFQFALEREVRREDIPFECLSFEAEGRVAKIIVRGEPEYILRMLEALHPLFVEEIAVDFEELFLCEVQKRGYMS